MHLAKERKFGDLRFARLDPFDSLTTMLGKQWDQWILLASMFFLNLMNIQKDLKEVVSMLHPSKQSLQVRYPEPEPVKRLDPDYYEEEAEYRSYIIDYPHQIEHDFENTESAMAHWSLHCVKLALLCVNGYQFFHLHRQTCASALSFFLTFLGLVKKFYKVFQYHSRRARYIEHFLTLTQDRRRAVSKRAADKLARFWCQSPAQSPADEEEDHSDDSDGGGGLSIHRGRGLPGPRPGPAPAPAAHPDTPLLP